MGDVGTVLLLTFALIALALFLIVQTSVKHPMMPPHILKNRSRGGAYIGDVPPGLWHHEHVQLAQPLPAAGPRLHPAPDGPYVARGCSAACDERHGGRTESAFKPTMPRAWVPGIVGLLSCRELSSLHEVFTPCVWRSIGKRQGFLGLPLSPQGPAVRDSHGRGVPQLRLRRCRCVARVRRR